MLNEPDAWLGGYSLNVWSQNVFDTLANPPGEQGYFLSYVPKHPISLFRI